MNPVSNRKFLFIITLTAVFYLSVVVASSDSATINAVAVEIVYAQNIVIPEERPFVSILGSAEKEVPSDESRITLAVENTNTNPNTARENNADKMNSILEVLKQNGLSNENITTSNFQIYPNYDYANENFDRVISYTALNKIELSTSATSNISRFIDLAVNNGANRVENIEFVVSKEKLDETNKELLKEAFKNAKDKAEILATQGGFNLTGIKQIDAGSQQDFGSIYRYDTIGTMEATDQKIEDPTQIIPQKTKVSVSLPVVFFINNQPQ